MAAEPEMRIEVLAVVTGLDDLAGRMRRTGEALITAADSLQRLSDGGPDTARTLPAVDTAGKPDPDESWAGGVCPFVSGRIAHEAHRFQVDTDVSRIGAPVLNFDCPGHPVRPWHKGGRPDMPCPKVSAGRVHLPHMTDTSGGHPKRCPGYTG
jgi:hypothetical protein